MEFQDIKYIKPLGHKVRTPFGYQTIEYVCKTPPTETLEIHHTNGVIRVAQHHTFIVHGEEIQASDLSPGDLLQTYGTDAVEILKIRPLGKQVLYDISLDQEEFENQWYYSDGILSHNSGKSITVACYLCWLFNFHRQMNIGIVANRAAQAKEFLRNTKDIFVKLPMWITPGVTEWNKSMVANENEMRILTDVPSSDSFRGFSCHCLVIDECAFIKTESWEEFADSIFPSQGALAWKKNIIISTAKGLNHFYEIVQRAKASTISKAQGEPDGTVLVEVHWSEVPRYGPDGKLITPEEFRERIIKRYGRAYFEQNYGNNFQGSAETLLDAEILDLMVPKTSEEQWGELRVYEAPKAGHTYIMGVDAAKDGVDAFAVQIFDVTVFPFRQVASCQSQTNYLEMPEHLYNWGTEYNTALMIIENNEGAGQSVADSLMQNYEYPNLHYDKGKKYPGFRTTKSSRDAILKLIQILGNAKKLEIVDKPTIEEFQKFEKINNKFQAPPGGSDDMVMALALCISPLADMDNFEDFGAFLRSLRSDDAVVTTSFLTDLVSMSFADD